MEVCNFFLRTFKILHVQSTIFFKEYLKFYAFKENEHYYSKNLHNFVRSKYVIFQRTYTILYFQRTQFFLIVEIQCIQQTLLHKIYIILYVQNKQFWKFYTLNNQYDLKILLNFVHLKYIIFWRTFTILHVECTTHFKKMLKMLRI